MSMTRAFESCLAWVRLSSRAALAAVIAATVALLSVSVGPSPAGAAAAEVGYRDFSYGAGTTAPTADKPQSKLWFTAGSWWGSLFSPASHAFTIHRLDGPTQEWLDTGVVVDERPNAKVDALWEGTHLYVAAVGPSSASATDSARVTRFSIVDGLYVRDPGYPVTVVPGGSESIVLDRDGTGALWVTFTRGGKVYVTHSTSGDASWVTPYVLPVPGADDISADDISTLVSFGGRIGVMWGNQNAASPSGNSYWFAVHRDGADDSSASWSRELAYGGDRAVENADDHLNIKSLQTDSEGRVFAAVKTSLNGTTDPLIVLLVRSPTGEWDRDNVFGRAGENHTRAIVLLDDTNQRAHVFAASPCCSGGVIYHKQVSFAALANGNPFASGLGAPFIRSSLDTTINNPTSTKQTVSAATGLVVLAGDDTSRWYLHNRLELAAPQTVVPDTQLDSGPSGNVGSTSASFVFSSENTAASFECRLDGAAFEACVSPTQYTGLAAGSHTFEVRAVTAAGPDPTPASRTWTVDENLPATFVPAADAAVKGGTSSAGAFGTTTTLLADTSPQEESYLRFDVTGVGARRVVGATLRLYATNGSTNGPGLHTASTEWSESTVTWNTKPARAATPVATKGAVAAKAWTEYDVTSVVKGDGTFGFALVPDSSDGTDLDSREAVNKPQLVLRFATDTTAPETTLTSAPVGTVDTGTADIAFEASEPSRFECRLDGSELTACTSPQHYADLPNGDHLFEVRAVDTAGNVDTTPATAAWTVQRADATAPETTIVSAPTGTVAAGDALIEFTADEPGTFQCALDGSPFGDCESPVSYNGLPDGPHGFEVRAVDQAGNVDPSPAGATWTVATGRLLSDGFESGGLGAWTVRTAGDGTATAQSDVVNQGAFAARLSETANTGSAAALRRTFETGQQDLTVAYDVQVAAEGPVGSNVPLVRIFDGSGTRVLNLYRQNVARDRVYVGYDGSTFLTKGLLPLGTWARVEVHVRLGGAGQTGQSQVVVSLNGAEVYSSATASVATGLRTVQIGNETAKQPFVLYADDVLVSRPVA